MGQKRTIDTLGGVGSMGAGLMCIWLALSHDRHDQMFIVWWVTCAVLVVNGTLMLIHANRKGGIKGFARDLAHPDVLLHPHRDAAHAVSHKGS